MPRGHGLANEHWGGLKPVLQKQLGTQLKIYIDWKANRVYVLWGIMFENIGDIVLLFWRTLLALPTAWRQRQKVFEQFFEIGNASLLMVCTLSFFIGGVIALNFGPALVERSLANAVGGVVGLAIAKELSPVMMAILIAGRIGSAMAAEIGSMRVYQEIDALYTMNINPVPYLVLPRLLAIAVALPLLVIISILVGWTGGAVVSATNHQIAVSFQS